MIFSRMGGTVHLRRIDWFLCSLLALLISGCGFVGIGGPELPLMREMNPLPSDNVCRVAVVPFVNQTEYPLGDLVVTKAFTARLLSSGKGGLIQEGDVLKVKQQMRLFPSQAPDIEQLQIIADRIGAQFLVTGVIKEMREDPLKQGVVNPKLFFEIQLRDGKTGDMLWNVVHRRQGLEYQKTMHFGTIYSMTGLARQMSEEIITLMNEKGFSLCNVFSLP